MQVYRTDVLVSGELCDVHARFERRVGRDQTARYHTRVAFCGVYVRPNGPVPGWWYFPASERSPVTSAPTAEAILRSLGVDVEVAS